jgi:hypothetical protein
MNLLGKHADMDSKSNKSRLTIGLLIDGLYGMGSYQNEVWKGVLKGAELEGANLICFSGGTIKHSPNNPYESYRNIVYSFINKELLDRLTLGGFLKKTSKMKNAFVREKMKTIL